MIAELGGPVGTDSGAALKGRADHEGSREQTCRELDPELAEAPGSTVQDHPYAQADDRDRGGRQHARPDEAQARDEPRDRFGLAVATDDGDQGAQ